MQSRIWIEFLLDRTRLSACKRFTKLLLDTLNFHRTYRCFSLLRLRWHRLHSACSDLTFRRTESVVLRRALSAKRYSPAKVINVFRFFEKKTAKISIVKLKVVNSQLKRRIPAPRCQSMALSPAKAVRHTSAGNARRSPPACTRRQRWTSAPHKAVRHTSAGNARLALQRRVNNRHARLQNNTKYISMEIQGRIIARARKALRRSQVHGQPLGKLKITCSNARAISSPHGVQRVWEKTKSASTTCRWARK